MPQNYNDTIHKMATPFEMRAGLPKKEPKMLEDWENNEGGSGLQYGEGWN